MAKSNVKKMSFGKQMKKYGSLWLFFIPSAVMMLIFCYTPMTGIIMAFKENPKMLGTSPVQAILNAKWVGLKWFKMLFSDPDILHAFRNTIVISFEKLVILFPLPIALAILITELRSRVVKKSLQITMYLPYFLSWVTVGGIFFGILNKDTGMFNNFLAFFGHERYAFTYSNTTMRGILVLTQAWKWIGWSSIVYISAIMALDTNLTEAARIDGATKWQQIWHVILPGILPTIAVMLVMRMGGLMDAGFEQIFTMYSPYVKDSVDILGTYTYRLIRENGLLPQYSLSTAVGLFNSTVSMTLVLTANYCSRKFFSRGLW